MLLETRVNDAPLFIDCEAAGGFSKDEAHNDFHPDDAIANVVKISTAIAQHLSATADISTGDGGPSAGVTIKFGVKVDGNALVCVARDASAAQFQVEVRYG